MYLTSEFFKIWWHVANFKTGLGISSEALWPCSIIRGESHKEINKFVTHELYSHNSTKSIEIFEVINDSKHIEVHLKTVAEITNNI